MRRQHRNRNKLKGSWRVIRDIRIVSATLILFFVYFCILLFINKVILPTLFIYVLIYFGGCLPFWWLNCQFPNTYAILAFPQVIADCSNNETMVLCCKVRITSVFLFCLHMYIFLKPHTQSHSAQALSR